MVEEATVILSNSKFFLQKASRDDQLGIGGNGKI